MAAIRIPREFLGAFRAGHRLASKDFIDEELSRELLHKVMQGCDKSKELLAYLTKFNNEYHKNVIKKGDPTALHKTNELRRDCYARENARNREAFGNCTIFRGLYERENKHDEEMDD